MNWCQLHWDVLREGVFASPLAPFVAESGEEVASRIARNISGEGESIDTYDPLIAISMGITAMIMEQGVGFFLDCPVCLCNQQCPCPRENCGEEYIPWAIEQEVARIQREGLVP